MRVPFRLAAVALLLAALTGCAMQNPSNHFADITFEQLPKIRLDVSDVLVENDYDSSDKPPHVERRFPVAPADAAMQWARDRLQATGDHLTFRYIVREASATETNLPKTTGLTGMLTTDQSQRYEVHIRIEMQLLDGNEALGLANAEARHSVTVPEDITLNDREKAWYKLTKDTMDDLNKQLETTIHGAFFPYIVL